MHTLTTAATLLAYSEWLDSEGLMAPSTDPENPNDDKGEVLRLRQGVTHQELVNEFIEQWESNPNRAILAHGDHYESDDKDDESDGKVNRPAGTAPSTKEAVKALTKLARTSKKEEIRLQASQTLLNYDHVVRS